MNIPAPTDNIFKFYAIFGLTLIIATIVGALQLSEKTNRLIYEYAVELYSTEQKTPTDSEERYKNLLNKLIVIAIKDRTTISVTLGLTGAIGIFFAFYGFRKWHIEIQPKHDELLTLQIKTLRKEIKEKA